MFGESFLAAPVVDRGAKKWDVYLPVYSSDLGSRWLDVWSNFKVMDNCSSYDCQDKEMVNHCISAALITSMMKVMEDSELDLVNITVEEGKRDTYCIVTMAGKLWQGFVIW